MLAQRGLQKLPKSTDADVLPPQRREFPSIVFDVELRIHLLGRPLIPSAANRLEIGSHRFSMGPLHIRLALFIRNEKKRSFRISFLWQTRGHIGQRFDEGAPRHFSQLIHLG